MYELSNVTKNYQKGRRTIPALRGLNLVIGDGEWLAVQGRTGHGKTTLLQILGGLDRPSTGTVTFDGRDLAELREVQVTRLRAESIGRAERPGTPPALPAIRRAAAAGRDRPRPGQATASTAG